MIFQQSSRRLLFIDFHAFVAQVIALYVSCISGCVANVHVQSKYRLFWRSYLETVGMTSGKVFAGIERKSTSTLS